MFATVQEYNAFLASQATTLIRLHGGAKATAANAAAECIAGIRVKLIPNVAAALALLDFSSHDTAALTKPGAESMTVQQVAWYAFLEDLRARIMA